MASRRFNIAYCLLITLMLIIHAPIKVYNQDLVQELLGKVNLEKNWERFKLKYNKTYTLFGENMRRLLWEENLEKIKQHNLDADKGLYEYSLKDNHLSDMSLREYIRAMVKLSRSRRRKLGKESLVGAPHHNAADIPEEIDWRNKGYVTPSLNQEKCGACYAFSVAGSVEAQQLILTGNLVRLSEQQILDCSGSMGNLGCEGGSLRASMKYIQRRGLMTADAYPYTASVQGCKYTEKQTVASIKSYSVLPAHDEYALQVAVATIGPIAVSINASPYTFAFYSKGVYNDEQCSSTTLNHAMLLIGYTKEAWILKNWWSNEWGQNGYMHLKRGINRCGVANYAVYAELSIN